MALRVKHGEKRIFRNVSDGEMAILRGRIFNDRKQDAKANLIPNARSNPQPEGSSETREKTQKPKSTAEAVAKELGVSRAVKSDPAGTLADRVVALTSN
ncbi:hypothetical protein [Rubripirellula lacrimiformis]|uniref:hypothetical protein n=1 Tax=Rubripirellula lacrimiformis TaxID=1930273 RepID=UPI0011AABC8E|nr:hypothetical protein [Rubripirellula lacrimiformis]